MPSGWAGVRRSQPARRKPGLKRAPLRTSKRTKSQAHNSPYLLGKPDPTFLLALKASQVSLEAVLDRVAFNLTIFWRGVVMRIVVMRIKVVIQRSCFLAVAEQG